MLYAGLDYHKRYSVVQAMDEQGRKRERARLPNEYEAIRDFFDGLRKESGSGLVMQHFLRDHKVHFDMAVMSDSPAESGGGPHLSSSCVSGD